jgi:hypothetical protein
MCLGVILSSLVGGKYEMKSGLVPNDAVAWFVRHLQGVIPNRAAPTNAPAHRIKTAIKVSSTVLAAMVGLRLAFFGEIITRR